MTAIKQALTLLLAVALVSACGKRSGATSPGPGAVGGAAGTSLARPGGVVTPPLTIAPTPLGARSPALASAHGAPHVSVIEHVALAIDRPAALTRGSLGDIRLWTALDGSVEPVAVPVTGARTFSLASHPQGWRIGIVDTAGSAQLWHYDARAGFAQLFARSPHHETRQVQVLPGGERAIALRRDHSLQLLDEHGAELTALNLRGFRPMTVRLARDGRALVALSARPDPPREQPSPDQPGILPELRTRKHDIMVAGVAIGPGDRPALSRTFSAKLRVQSSGQDPRVAVSANGRRVAFIETLLDHRPIIDVHVVELPAGKPRRVAHKLPAGRHIDFGFVDERTLIVAASHEGLAWAIDTAAGDRIKPIGAGASVSNMRTAHAWGQGLHLTGTSRWLHVHGRDGAAGLYLGYQTFAPANVAFSPSGKKLLWIDSDNLAYIEPLLAADQRAITYASTDRGQLGRGTFIDEDTLALLDRNGRLSLVHYRTGEILARGDAGGPAGQQLHYDPASGLIHLARGELDVWLYHLGRTTDGGFALAGPYIIRTANVMRTGILRGAGPSVLWTVDEQMVYRTYTLAEIRSQMSYRDMLDRGRQIIGEYVTTNQSDRPGTLVTIDVTGRRYYLHKNQLAVYPRPLSGRNPERTDDLNRLYTIPAGNLSRTVGSPDGSRIAVVTQEFSVRVHDASTGARLWSYTVASSITDLTWSADGALLAVASSGGGLILDSTRGVPVHRSCGPWFEARVAAPALHVRMSVEPALCGL